MKRTAILFLMLAICHVVAFASTNAVPVAVVPTNVVYKTVRNPFWPIGYTGETTRISAEVRPKPKPKPKPPKVMPKKNEIAAKEVAAKAGKEVAEKTVVVEKVTQPREITSEDWRKAQKALKFGSQALFKAEDGTTRSSISINGNIYVDGDLMSFTHDGARFTWRIQGLDGKDKKLKLKRIQARLIEQLKKTEPKKTGGGK